uniref:TfoX_C domain-containing protein n=1 Tax=Heterorhabditis bacteriophora TaxID=37862 RepID=A0A1I7WSC8_HETBA
MSHAPKLSLHERGRIKALSIAGYTVKQIADVGNFADNVECTISIVGIRRTCGIDASKSMMCRMPDKCDWEKVQPSQVFNNKPINSLFRI